MKYYYVVLEHLDSHHVPIKEGYFINDNPHKFVYLKNKNEQNKEIPPLDFWVITFYKKISKKTYNLYWSKENE